MLVCNNGLVAKKDDSLFNTSTFLKSVKRRR